MKLTLTPTEEIRIQRFTCLRIWEGMSGNRVPVRAAIAWVQPQTDDPEQLREFDAELMLVEPAVPVLPYTKNVRACALASSIRTLSGLKESDVLKLLTLLSGNDSVMSELMAICARTGPALTDSGFEFTPRNEAWRTPAYWSLGGDSLGDAATTHHLPEPNDPGEVLT